MKLLSSLLLIIIYYATDIVARWPLIMSYLFICFRQWKIQYNEIYTVCGWIASLSEHEVAILASLFFRSVHRSYALKTEYVRCDCGANLQISPALLQFKTSFLLTLPRKVYIYTSSWGSSWSWPVILIILTFEASLGRAWTLPREERWRTVVWNAGAWQQTSGN